MFDRIVAPTDEEARRRSAASLAITAALCGAAAVGFMVGSLAWWAAPALGPGEDDEGMNVVMVGPEGGGTEEIELPKAPPRPQPQAAADPAAESEPDPDAEPTAAADPQPRPTGSTESSGTSEGGGDLGTGGGTGGGTTRQDGTPGGEPCEVSGGCEPVRLIEHPNPVAKRRVQPQYPDAAKALALGEQKCVATVRIDAEGVPYQVDVAGCPAAFHPETREALLKWRWYAAKAGGSRVASQTVVAVVYRLDD
jgi:hypothetical protein